MKTLKDLRTYGLASNVISKNELKQEAIEWINEIDKRSSEHWEQLDKKGYTKMEDPYKWKLDGISFRDWHEASDPEGAIMILKHLFNITEEDLEAQSNTSVSGESK